jgi:hypothetical protein
MLTLELHNKRERSNRKGERDTEGTTDQETDEQNGSMHLSDLLAK